ncbi:MAG: NAD-dependent epimerase/dehydratase family protein [Myxococcota bacterium]
MKYRVLITGGAGFIGSHLADALLANGHSVRALDNLSPQVHGSGQRRPAYLARDVELCVGDVRDARAVARALEGVDAVYHFAAMVGVSQSMYKVHDYVDVNSGGTAVLLECLAKKPVRKLVVASSMSIYGEGSYLDAAGREVNVRGRSIQQLRRGEWELSGADGQALSPRPTPESKTPTLESIYALTKYDQEQQCLMVGRAYDIPTTALRFFNVFGPRQALSNPYTGVLAIFSSRLLNDRVPLVYEDGLQRRDFVSVHDVVQACMACLTKRESDGLAINVGSGKSISILDVATKIAVALGKTPAAEVTGKYRVGDIRHCFSDISRAVEVLGYQPRVGFDEGIQELASSIRGALAHDRLNEARAELDARGLTL